jgi:hypothetical protein
MSSTIPNPLYTKNLADTVESTSKQVQDEIKNHNTYSEVYRNTVRTIDDKIILLSAGSISLLLTFIGILFNSTRDVSQLHYYFVVAAITSWLISIILLLLSRWNEVLYLTHSVHINYLSALERKTKAEIKFYKAYPNIVSEDTLERFTDQELNKIVKDGEDYYNLIKDNAKKTTKKESMHDKLNKIFRLSGHLLFVVGFMLATLFFFGVLNLMRG